MAQAWVDLGDHGDPVELPDLGVPTYKALPHGLLVTHEHGVKYLITWNELFALPCDDWPSLLYRHEMEHQIAMKE